MHALVHSINYNMPQFSDHLCCIFLMFQIDPVTIMYLDYLQSWFRVGISYKPIVIIPVPPPVLPEPNAMIVIDIRTKACEDMCMYVLMMYKHTYVYSQAHLSYHAYMIVHAYMHVCTCFPQTARAHHACSDACSWTKDSLKNWTRIGDTWILYNF